MLAKGDISHFESTSEVPMSFTKLSLEYVDTTSNTKIYDLNTEIQIAAGEYKVDVADVTSNIKSGIQLNPVTKHLILTGDATTFDSNTHQDAVPTIKYVKELVPTKTSQLTNDSSYLTSHQDISGKANTSLNNLTSAGNTYIDNRIANAIANQLNVQLDAIYPVGSWYFCTQSTCPMASLISGSTWEKVGSSLITGVDTNVPIAGNGKSFVLTNGSQSCTMSVYNYLQGTKQANSVNIGTAITRTGDISTNNAWGFSTDANQSGLVGTVTRSALTVNIFKRTA